MVAQKLQGAWVFEDDVLLHQKMVQVFPSYWEKVPTNYSVVYVGQLERECTWAPADPATCQHSELVEAVGTLPPWTTHAYIISLQQAEQQALYTRHILERANVGGNFQHLPHDRQGYSKQWTLQQGDIKIDFLFAEVFSKLTKEGDKGSWVVFHSTEAVPAMYGDVLWASGGPSAAAISCRHCDCLAALHDDICISNKVLPLRGTGLAYQQLCKKHPRAFEIVIEKIHAYEYHEGDGQGASMRMACNGIHL